MGTGPELCVIALRDIQKGEKDIAGVTDVEKPNRLGRKRKNRIIKDFNLDKKLDDVRKYVVHRAITKKDKPDQTFYKAPRIQRMVTEKRLRRKAMIKRTKIEGVKASQKAKAEYEKILASYAKERRAAHEKAKADKA